MTDPAESAPANVPALVGAEVIRAALSTIPSNPGVYRMSGAGGLLLYVGKARNLKRRVANYIKPAGLGGRILRMVSEVRSIEITTTHTEAEALLLEANLIKRLKPRYNVILRDDKSFPYILIEGDHDFPRIAKHRGARNRKGDYFGPFASAGAVNRTLGALARVFPLRSCGDGDFATRTRPCLQYQIKRCTAPCVAKITVADYAAIVGEARDFLTGRSQDLVKRLSGRMEAAAEALDFETAALFRDRLRAFAHVTAHQGINVEGLGDCDLFALHAEGGETAIQVYFYRGGQNFGNRAYFPAHAREAETGEVMAAFIAQFYDARTAAPLILASTEVADADLLAEALSLRAGRKVEIALPQRGAKRELVDQALLNAREALGRRQAESATQRRLLEGLADLLELDATPERIEVYDNSHTQGSLQLGGMIVAGPNGFIKAAYRRFNIKGNDVRPGDDFAMMREVLTRRFTRLLAESEQAEDGGDRADWPDLLLIDGGKGQLGVAQAVLDELGIDDVALAAVSKGPDRNAGLEVIHRTGKPELTPERRDPVLYFIQRLRDEAHRFAIGGHRARRAAAAKGSALDEVPGIGARRKKALLLHFGSAKAIAEAGITDLTTVEGISAKVAQKIYDHFHGGG